MGLFLRDQFKICNPVVLLNTLDFPKVGGLVARGRVESVLWGGSCSKSLYRLQSVA